MPVQPDTDCIGTNDSEYQSYAINTQQTIPVCDTTTPCSVEILTVDVTNVTTQGGSDGEIQVTISGATGNVTYYLNGTVYSSGTTNTSYTYTGLAAGYYQVVVEDDECLDTQDNIKVLDGEFRTGDFIVSEPSILTASENPIIYDINTQVIGVGEQAEIEFEIMDGQINDGDSIIFNLSSPYAYQQTFMASTFPDKSNYFLASHLMDNGEVVGTNTKEEIAQSLSDALMQDILIPKVYYISYDGATKIKLKAKEVGERFTLDNENVTINTSEIGFNIIQVGVNQYDGQRVDGYSIYVELFVNRDVSHYPNEGDLENYDFITELDLPYQYNNNHRFDLSNILKNYVYSSRPDHNFSGYTIQPYMLNSYYIKYGEKYPLIKNTNTKKKRYKDKTNVKFFINSALSRYEPNTMTGYTGTDNGTDITGVKFLTNSPNPKLIQRDSTEFLYFIYPENYNSNHSFVCRGDIYYYDGTSDTNVNFFTIINTNENAAGGVMTIDISYDKLNLSTYETGKKIRRVDLWVEQDNGGTITQYSEVKSYQLAVEDKDTKFGVIFQNLLGGYDAFDFVGIIEETIDRTYGTYTLPLTANKDGSQSQGFKKTSTYNVQTVKKVTVNSGWLNEEHFNWLNELMQSNEIYSYTTDNMNYLNLTSFKYKKTSNDDLYDVECTFLLTIYENNISL